MPAKKKQVRNAFYFFMKELEPQLRREGRVFQNGMADIVPIAHPRWKDLPQKEKERFENMAKTYKAKMRGGEGDKYRQDNQGDIIAYRKDHYTELDKRRANEKKDMRRNWPPGKELADEQFYFINFQSLCVTEEGHYLPCEIAVIEYSLAKGITKQLHRFINPGKIPTGYRYTCQQNSDDTHQIPIENFELADSNYRGLWIQLENFINPNGEKDEYPPLYCLGSKDNFSMVEYSLEWIHGHACLGIPNRLHKVYEVESLFQEMYAHIGQSMSKATCIDLLTSSEWDYESGTRCDYHEQAEVKYCSLGIVNRYAYAISDRTCEYYDVKVTPKHVPMKANFQNFKVLSPSSMPVCTKQDARLPVKSNDFSSQPKAAAKKREPIDEDYEELRKPHIPGGVNGRGPAWSGDMRGATGGSLDQFTMSGVRAAEPAYGGPMGGPSGDFFGRGRGMSFGLEDDFPSLNISGRGTAIKQPAPVGRGIASQPPSYAGRGAPPQPSQFSPYPDGLQNISMPVQQSAGIGRGRIVQPPPMMMDDGGLTGLRIPGQTAAPTSVVDNQAPLRMPGQTQVPQQFEATQPGPQSSSSSIAFMPGRGRGAILEQVMKTGRKPKGRGFAPPDWVDDGSFAVLK